MSGCRSQTLQAYAESVLSGTIIAEESKKNTESSHLDIIYEGLKSTFQFLNSTEMEKKINTFMNTEETKKADQAKKVELNKKEMKNSLTYPLAEQDKKDVRNSLVHSLEESVEVLRAIKKSQTGKPFVIHYAHELSSAMNYVKSTIAPHMGLLIKDFHHIHNVHEVSSKSFAGAEIFIPICYRSGITDKPDALSGENLTKAINTYLNERVSTICIYLGRSGHLDGKLLKGDAQSLNKWLRDNYKTLAELKQKSEKAGINLSILTREGLKNDEDFNEALRSINELNDSMFQGLLSCSLKSAEKYIARQHRQSAIVAPVTSSVEQDDGSVKKTNSANIVSFSSSASVLSQLNQSLPPTPPQSEAAIQSASAKSLAEFYMRDATNAILSGEEEKLTAVEKVYFRGLRILVAALDNNTPAPKEETKAAIKIGC